jgi:hypothetical protein
MNPNLIRQSTSYVAQCNTVEDQDSPHHDPLSQRIPISTKITKCQNIIKFHFHILSSFFTYTIYHTSKERDLVSVWEKRVIWTRCWIILLMSFTISKTALGCASLSAFCEYFFRSSLSGPNHLATILAASFGSFENSPAPLSTT